MRMKIALAIFCFLWNVLLLSPQTAKLPSDPFDLHVAGVQLNDETIVSALANFTADLPIAVSVEYELASKLNASATPLQRFNASIPAGTVTEVTNRIVSLDPTFTWIRHGNVINLVPKTKISDPNYLFNRVIVSANLQSADRADAAALQVVTSLPGKREQLAILNTGGSISFPEPWTVTFSNMTVRQALDLIAQQLGGKYGWQVGGSTEFRLLTFHARLKPFEPEKLPPSK